MNLRNLKTNAKHMTISSEEYERTSDQAAVAHEILEDDRFQFLRDYLQASVDYAKKCILENTIHDLKEDVTISDRIRHIFFTPKKQQVDELVGQYKLITKLFRDMEFFIQAKRDLDAQIVAGRVKVAQDDGQV